MKTGLDALGTAENESGSAKYENESGGAKRENASRRPRYSQKHVRERET
jgi:hypothetical protein